MMAINRENRVQGKELIISYKEGHSNTINLVVMDMFKHGNMIYKHESFALWEQTIKGILVTKTKDFVTLSKNGLSIMSLGEMDKR